MRAALLLLLALFAGRPGAPSNLSVFRLSDGDGELEWISPCSFRLARYWGKAPPSGQAINPEMVKVSQSDRGSSVRFSTGCLTVEVEKATLRLEVSGQAGRVMTDAAAPQKTAQGLVVERAAVPGEAYFGLGPRAAPSADLRGLEITAARPLLISSLGYGEFFPMGGSCLYDLARARPDRRRVTLKGTDHVEYFFYYGPTPREILGEHASIAGTFSGYDSKAFRILESSEVPRAATRIAVRGPGSWTSLEESVRSLVHASWSALLVPALDLSPYEAGPDLLFARAAQLGAAVPVVYASLPRGGQGALQETYRRTAEMRKRLTPYLATCAYEARQFGFPMIRPIAMQSPGDRQAAARETTEFMLGEALLIAPIFTPEAHRTVYLPAGAWTNLRTSQIYKGRQTIRIQAVQDELPMFAKHVSILPLAPPEDRDLLTLNYFAGGAAECLLMEEDREAVSQFHAAPAGGIMRLEIQSAKRRTCEWIVRHAGPCREVVSGGAAYVQVKSSDELRPGSWFFDQAKNEIHIQCLVSAGEERIIHVTPGSRPLAEKL